MRTDFENYGVLPNGRRVNTSRVYEVDAESSPSSSFFCISGELEPHLGLKHFPAREYGTMRANEGD